jgi:hypothetical protein
VTPNPLHLSAAGRVIGRRDVLALMHTLGVYHLFNALTQGATAVLVALFDRGAVATWGPDEPRRPPPP